MINLKEIRKTCGLAQTEIAKLLGIPQQQYSRYELNKTKITLDTFLKILEICNYRFEIKNTNLQKKEKRV